MQIAPIATFHSPFATKFGVPKQSGLAPSLRGYVVFESQYRQPELLRGIDGFDYLWLIWGFSANRHAATGSTVRPPLLGGNVRMGVLATRSPFRPNGLGLSSVRLSHVEWHSSQGPLLHVLGADLMDGTPIYDVKPYVPYADAHPLARAGFVDSTPIHRLEVVADSTFTSFFSAEEWCTLCEVLSLDPRPHYHSDATKIYGMVFSGCDVRFRVENDRLTVVDVVRIATS